MWSELPNLLETNKQGKTIRYIFNYSTVPQQVKYVFKNGKELLSDKAISENSTLEIEEWEVKIVEEN